MSITLELKPEIESNLIAQAAARNVSVEDYIEDVLETMFGSSEYKSLTADQRAKELDEWLNSHSYIKAPPLSDEAVSRENIYREREDSQL